MQKNRKKKPVNKPSTRSLIAQLQIQWQDLHNSRDQEWKCLNIVIMIFMGLVGLSVWRGQFFFSVLAAWIALNGLMITWHHRSLFNEKMSIISHIEKDLGIRYKPPEIEEHANWFTRLKRKRIGPFRVGCTSFLISLIYWGMFVMALALAAYLTKF